MHPTLIRIGDFELSTFGLMLALAFLVGGWMAARSFEREGLEGDIAWRILTWCLIGGIVGSKVWFVGEQVARQTEVGIFDLVFSRGGLTWYGGLLGGTIAGLACARVAGVPLLTGLNCAAPTLAVGQAIGRVGCLLVGDCYGRVTQVPWGITFPDGIEPTQLPVHPTMVYESLWLALGGLWLWRRRGHSPFLFGEYLLIAGVGRFWIEAFRTNPEILLRLSNAQVTALVCVVVGAVSWLRFRRQALA